MNKRNISILNPGAR